MGNISKWQSSVALYHTIIQICSAILKHLFKEKYSIHRKYIENCRITWLARQKRNPYFYYINIYDYAKRANNIIFRTTVLGVTSSGTSNIGHCGGINNPTHYTRLKKVLPWMLRYISEDELCWADSNSIPAPLG